ncbi:MAG: repair protein RadC [Thermoanaerobacteraceae bacterium]|uniref:JAB domain-containing protein n=1 Tax=Biomaibacter acetigenes TaxID=2316383 RepID=A0A3G2R686_9FIRM|nr:DNA repair protein RadC [Biomaibacter acetigenes]AYO30980.1 JAB domain-containing protein [Biomaibacter acetigenes]MDK2880173.1 repair protein RadC [Thermoanaerobacteraceae bacterium]MDN5311043.1 repair protein RadC [Thermoanaerobacteraceae bacterium]
MTKSFTIKDLPKEERPRERLERYGAQVLSDAELLALLIRTGTPTESALVLAQRILKGDGAKSGLAFVADSSIEELSKIKGIGLAKSVQIKAAVELGRRISSYTGQNPTVINTPVDVKNLLMEEMRFLEKEHFKVILLNIKNHVISVEDVSVGSLNSSIVHPREVFKPAIRRSSASMILVHNHPSGDPAPSREDVEITRRLIEAGKILGIEVVDHVIIGNGVYISLREKGII